jgi:UDP-N-acetylmuramate--alanine ligase
MPDVDISQIKKVFIIGIGGIGISALAKLFLARGVEVLGLNDEESPATLEPLRKAGAMIYYMNELKELPDADLYIYSDAWLYRGPELIKNAKSRGTTLSYFEALGEIAKKYKVIAISGTHGKTTTTAMVAEIMVDAGLDPTVIVGSFVKKFSSNFRAGKSEWLVVEADEYHRHFLNFHPYIGVVTNIEADHLDYYKDLPELEAAFEKFLAQSEHKVVDYVKHLEDVPALLVPGVHNKMNAAAALAVADILGIKKEVAQKALANFEGTWRRLEKRGVTAKGTIVYDDYAHHPTEIKASLEALRELYPKAAGKKIWVVFQPHLYSRTRAFFKEFSQAFSLADHVYLLPIYFAREDPDPEISSEVLAEAIDILGTPALAIPDFDQAKELVEVLDLGKNDIFVTMGAGEAYKVADSALKFE